MALKAQKKPTKKQPPQSVYAVDLFCGVGGKTHGFIKAGLPVVAGYDIDGSCQFAYEHNNAGAKFVRKGIEDLSAKELLECYPANAVKVLIGCAPCQPFSTYSYRYGKTSVPDNEDMGAGNMQNAKLTATTMLIMLSLTMTGCTPSPQQVISKNCSDAGYKEKAFEDCVATATVKYNKEQAIMERELAKMKEKRQLAEAKAIHDADKAKCSSFGFKIGSDGFAACMMKVQELRVQEQHRSQAIQELRTHVNSCNSSRALDSGDNSTGAVLNRFTSSSECSAAQVKAVELGVDPSKLLMPIPTISAPKQPVRFTCDTFAGTTDCTQW